jgi:hypothetical protein
MRHAARDKWTTGSSAFEPRRGTDGREEQSDFESAGGPWFRSVPSAAAVVWSRAPRPKTVVLSRPAAVRHGEFVQGQEEEETRLGGLFLGLFAVYLPGLQAASDAGQGDLLSALFEQFSDWAWHLNPIVFSFLLRTTVMLGLSVLFLWLAFYRGGSRSALLQSFIFMNCVILALMIPVERLQIPHRLVKAWVVAICIFWTAVGPSLLPLWLCSELGNQRRLRRIGYGALLFLLIGSLLRALPPWTN